MQQTIEAVKAHMEVNPTTDWEALKQAVPYSMHQSLLAATRVLHKEGYLRREAVRQDGKPNVILTKL